MALDDTGLLARFFIDEAASGTTPTSVLDASANNYHLTEVNYGGGNMAYAEPAADQRGLNSTVIVGDQRARRGIVSSDVIDTALQGSTAVTLEMVLRIDSHDGNSRIWGIQNRDGSTGILIVRGSITAGRLDMTINNLRVLTDIQIDFTTRVVFHVRIDTTQAVESDRIMLYEDGVRNTVGVTYSLPQNTTFNVEAGNADLIFFNRESFGNYGASWDGQMFYGAIYDVRMSEANITNNATDLLASDDTPSAGSSPNVNPTGSALQTLASGAVVFNGAGDPNILPSGSALLTLASDVVVLNISNTGIVTSPTGSTLQSMASGITTIQITLLPVEENPTGSTTQALDENSQVDIRNPVQLFLGPADGNGFFALTSGVPVFLGLAADLTIRPMDDPLEPDTINGDSTFDLLESGTTVISIITGTDVNVNPVGDGFPVLQPEIADPPRIWVTFGIDTDAEIDIANEGNEVGLLQSGVSVISNQQTGVLGTLPGVTFGLLTSSTAKFSQSHPTAPPGTAGGRLIIRSITQNITRPVTLATDVQITIASA